MGLQTGKETSVAWDLARGAFVPFLVLALASVTVAAAGEGAAAALRYDRAALGEGEWWRVLGAHLVHLGPSHLALNIAGLALVGWLTGRAWGAAGWSAITLAAAIAVCAGLWFLDPAVDWYVGLSGVLHGMLAAGLLPGLLRREPERLLLALLLVGKLVWETVAGPLPGSEASAGGPVLVQSHCYGALGGAAAAVAGLVLAARRGRTSSV